MNDQSAAMTRWLMLAVLCWGLLLALGAFLHGQKLSWVRAALVAGCTLGFLALWGLALFARRAKDRR